MNKIFVIIRILIVASIYATGAYAQRNEPFTTHTFGSFVMSSVNIVETSMTNGSITVTGGANPEAIVEMYVSGNSPAIRNRQWSDEEIKQELERSYTIEIKVDGEKLRVGVNPKNVRNPQFGLSFKITVPIQMNSNLHTTNGSINISNLSGSHDFRTTNGFLGVVNVSGNISGSTINGSITANNCSGKIILSTTNGGITANQIEGELTFNSNGGMKLENISGNVEAKISRIRNTGADNGRDLIVTMLSVNDFVKLSTDRDNVILTLPADNGYDLDVKANNITTSGLTDFRGSTVRRSLNGIVANGGSNIEINAPAQVNLTFNKSNLISNP